MKNIQNKTNLKNIAVLIDIYNPFGGASKAAAGYARHIRTLGYNTFIICNKLVRENNVPDDVFVLDSIYKCKCFLNNYDIDFIHYFKSAIPLGYSSIFYKINRAKEKVRKDIKSIITVCQQPSFPSTILTPYEIRHSEHIIFIDKTAYNDPLYRFIPKYRKTWMYLINSKDMPITDDYEKLVKQEYSSDNEVIIFGRGSTLNKCPKDTIEVFDNINTNKEKRFIIIGVPESSNWLSNKIKQRDIDNINTYPLQTQLKYAEIVSTLDIFLYYLPENIYSSIITAMRLGIPCVVYGPPAPKEMIIHGYNGYIANTKKEFIKYAELLANDIKQREIIGRNARKYRTENIPEINWKNAHINIIENVYNSDNEDAIKNPLLPTINIYIRKNLYLIYRLFNKLFNISLFFI